MGPCFGSLGKSATTGWDPCRRLMEREGVGTGLPSSSSSFYINDGGERGKWGRESEGKGVRVREVCIVQGEASGAAME